MAPVVPGHREGDPETTNSPYVPGFGAEFQPDPLKQKRLGEEGSRLSRKIAAFLLLRVAHYILSIDFPT